MNKLLEWMKKLSWGLCSEPLVEEPLELPKLEDFPMYRELSQKLITVMEEFQAEWPSLPIGTITIRSNSKIDKEVKDDDVVHS